MKWLFYWQILAIEVPQQITVPFLKLDTITKQLNIITNNLTKTITQVNVYIICSCNPPVRSSKALLKRSLIILEISLNILDIFSPLKAQVFINFGSSPFALAMPFCTWPAAPVFVSLVLLLTCLSWLSTSLLFPLELNGDSSFFPWFVLSSVCSAGGSWKAFFEDFWKHSPPYSKHSFLCLV